MKKITLFLTLISSLHAAGQSGIQDSIPAQELNEVIVRGERPQIKGHDGVLTVDLPAIVREKPVTNVLEALSYLPGVVDNNGSIGLSGATSVTIILNGELTNMPVQNLYQLLYSTPVDRLKNVEIMYAAPAKYHVSGAVINIVLKTPRPLDGLTGQLQAGYTQTRYPSYNTGAATTYALKDWTFDVNWTLSRNKTYSRQETYSNHLVNGQRTMIEDDMRQTGYNLSNLIYASIAYKPFRITYNGQITSDSHNNSLSTGTFGRYINRYSYLSPTGYHNISLRYTSTFGLTAGADYTSYSEDREQKLTKDATTLVRAFNRQTIERYHTYINMEHQSGRWQINYGLEYQHSDDHSRQSYILPSQEGFNDVLKEDVADAYIGLQASFDSGLSFSASAKGEYFHNDLQHNWNFIPQLGVTYYKTPKSIFQLNFTSQRIYPQYWELHGATSYINEYSSISGNPSLQPYMNYAAQLSYILNQKYSATLYMLHADKYSVQLPYQMPDKLQLMFQTVNFDFSRTVGLQFNAPFDIKDVFNTTAVVNISHKQEKATHFHDIGFDNRRWSFYGALNNTLKPSPGSPLSFSADATYITGQIQGPGKFNPLWRIDAGMKWRFGKQRSCEINLKFNDIFNTWKPKLTIDNAGQDYKLTAHDIARNLRLSFIWKFNGFRPKDLTVDTSRFGTGQ